MTTYLFGATLRTIGHGNYLLRMRCGTVHAHEISLDETSDINIIKK